MGACLSKDSSDDKYKAPEKNNEKADPASVSESGVVLEVKDNGQPPPDPDQAEQDQKLRKIFVQLDKDNSGFIDVNELKVILERLGLRVDHENVLFLMARYDDDHSGTLNFEEFSEMVLSIMSVKKQFDAVDNDKSGAISANEMQTFMANVGISAEVGKQIINLFDEDGSGVVEYSEFVTLVFYLNELEYQYNAYKEREVSDYSWINPMIGSENSTKAPTLVQRLQEMRKKKPFPSLSDFAQPIVLAAAGTHDPMGRNKKAPRIKTLRARVRPPPKKVLRIQHADIKRFSSDGSLFCDPEFPPSPDILPARMKSKICSWKRPSEINPNAKLFVNGVEEGDVIQGELGDCWFLGALAVVATCTENFIEYLFEQQRPEIGMYQCRFFKNGKWVHVMVDDRLPCDSRGNLVFASCKDSSEFWVPIVEKAYAKLHGSYDSLESGSISDGLKDLTGEGVEVARLDNKEVADAAWDMLMHNHNESFLMGCAIDDEQLQAETELECGLLVGHAYSIIGCAEVNGHKLLRMRNPWGQGEWKGPWSDESKEWTPALLKHFSYEFANDGTFFMSFADFKKFYSRVYVLRMLVDSIGELWHKSAFSGAWKSESAAGCANHPGWLSNPQYALQVTQPNTKIFANLSQPDLRYVLKKNPLSINKEYHPIGLYIIRTKDLAYRKMSYQPDEKEAASTFTTVRDQSFEFICPPGNYVVVPCTFTPGIEVDYGICLYSSKPITVYELTKVVPFKKLSGGWKGILAGGCANNRETWLRNPQFLLVCSTPGTVDIMLSQESIPNKPLEAIAVYVLGSANKSRLTQVETVLRKPATIINLPSVSETISVEANVNYIIMPTTFEPDKERKFTLTVASDTAQLSTFNPL